MQAGNKIYFGLPYKSSLDYIDPDSKTGSYDMQNIESYKDLKVWKKGMDLTKAIYLFTRGFPSEEKFGLSSQIRRSAVSIPSNIAEGYGRGSRIDYCRFLKIACGSLYECQTQLELALDFEYISPQQFSRTQSIAEEVSKMLNALIRKLEEKY